jgi:hypothetical protein
MLNQDIANSKHQRTTKRNIVGKDVKISNINAEELLKYIKICFEDLQLDEFEPIITPTMYDPDQLQNDVTIIITEKVEGGIIPRFSINVKDLEGIRNWNNAKHGL